MEAKEVKSTLLEIIEELRKKVEPTEGDKKILKDLENTETFIGQLKSQIELLKILKVDVNIVDHTIIHIKDLNQLQDELIRLRMIEKHYETKANAGATLKHAVADLLTYGLYTHNNETGEMAKQINPMIKTVIHTKNYIIQKAPAVEQPAEELAGGSTYHGEEVDENQGLIVIKRHIDNSKSETITV